MEDATRAIRPAFAAGDLNDREKYQKPQALSDLGTPVMSFAS